MDTACLVTVQRLRNFKMSHQEEGDSQNDWFGKHITFTALNQLSPSAAVFICDLLPSSEDNLKSGVAYLIF